MHSTNTTSVGASVPENFELTPVKKERRADTRLLAQHLGNQHETVMRLVFAVSNDVNMIIFDAMKWCLKEIE